MLTQWANYCENADAFFEIADLHAYTTEFDDPAKIRDARDEMVAVWLAAGVDPETVDDLPAIGRPGDRRAASAALDDHAGLVARARADLQGTDRRARAEDRDLRISWAIRCCSSATSRSFRGEYVPVGRDQVAHLELGREIVRRFNYLYGDGARFLIEPQPTLSEFPEVPGTDGRKMSKSYDNAIFIADDEETTTRKVRAMVTDPQKIRRGDPGRPEICPVFALWRFVNPLQSSTASRPNAARARWAACKTRPISPSSSTRICGPVRERYARYRDDPALVERIIADGTARAREIAAGVLADVKRAMKLIVKLVARGGTVCEEFAASGTPRIEFSDSGPREHVSRRESDVDDRGDRPT